MVYLKSFKMKIVSLMVFLTILNSADFKSYYCSQCKEEHHIGCYCLKANECRKQMKKTANNTYHKLPTNLIKSICNCSMFLMDNSNLNKIGCSVVDFDDSKMNCTCIEKKDLHDEKKPSEIEIVKKTEPKTERPWHSNFLNEFTPISDWHFFVWVFIGGLGITCCCMPVYIAFYH